MTLNTINNVVGKRGGDSGYNDTIWNAIMVHDICASGYGWCHENDTNMDISRVMQWVDDIVGAKYRHAHNYKVIGSLLLGVVQCSKGECA